MQSTVLGWSRSVKRLTVLVLDVCLSFLATWLAFSLRLDTLHVPEDAQWWVYGLAPLLSTPIFIRFGLYRAIFRYTGQAALLAVAKASGIYSILLLSILMTVQWLGVPRSLGILQPLIFCILVGTSRAVARFWLVSLYARRCAADTVPSRFLIFGAGRAGVQTASALGVGGAFSLVGFIDDDAAKVGRSINGIPIFACEQIPELVSQQGVTDILLALPKVSRTRRNAIIESLRHIPVHIRILPDWADVASGRVRMQDFKELDIEDLLGRDPVPPDAELLAHTIKNQVILVTGAGGSIGSELCRQIVRLQPRQLVLLEQSEFNLYAIHHELSSLISTLKNTLHTEVDLVAVLVSVTHAPRLTELFQQYRPHTVYHAAAYKHVPLVEANPVIGVENNTIGTLYAAQAAMAAGVKNFVLISTDKAVRPPNVMGASKRLAELVLQAFAHAQPQGTCFSMVRFGNVLGSSGSVVPLFRQQLAAGGPLTVTHAEVTRYFMTIPEAAQLVLQAGAMATGGEVFVLDMGEPIKIIDLARRMIELSGMTVRDASNPHGDMAIQVTGLRPGEKLYEELLIGDNPIPTAHRRIMKAREDFIPLAQLQSHLETLQQGIQTNDIEKLKTVMRQCVHGYGI